MAAAAGKNTPRAFPSELNRSENFYFTRASDLSRARRGALAPCFPPPRLDDAAMLYRTTDMILRISCGKEMN